MNINIQADSGTTALTPFKCVLQVYEKREVTKLHEITKVNELLNIQADRPFNEGNSRKCNYKSVVRVYIYIYLLF